MQHGEARRWYLPLLHSWGGLTTTACKLARFLPPSWIVGEVLALLVLWFMLYLQVCSPAVPLLSSLPSTTKMFMAVKPIFQALLLQFLSGTECFFQGRVTQFCLKISLWCLNVVSDWKCWTSSSFKMLQGRCGASPVLLPFPAMGILGQDGATLIQKPTWWFHTNSSIYKAQILCFPPVCSFN